jgi:transposase
MPPKMDNFHNAPTHRSVLVKDFLAEKNATTLEHPPYSPDLIPADIYRFPSLKSALK